jgi:hypothetical protein
MEVHLSRTLFVPLAAALLAVTAACSDTGRSPTAPAGGPNLAIGTGAHFQKASSSIGAGGLLSATFVEVGLGNTVPFVKVSLTADALALYACSNGGGNFPADPKKRSESGQVSGSSDFPITNGRASGTLTASPPPNSTLSCPGNQTPVLVSVSYTNVRITDVTNNVFVDLRDQSATFFTLRR